MRRPNYCLNLRCDVGVTVKTFFVLICTEADSWIWDPRAKRGVTFWRRWSREQRALTHLLEDIVQLLQGRTHSPVAAHATCVTIEVDVGHPVQSVVTEGADHRGPHRPPGLLVVGGLVQIRIVRSIDVLVPVRLIHHKSWERLRFFGQSSSDMLKHPNSWREYPWFWGLD